MVRERLFADRWEYLHAGASAISVADRFARTCFAEPQTVMEYDLQGDGIKWSMTFKLRGSDKPYTLSGSGGRWVITW